MDCDFKKLSVILMIGVFATVFLLQLPMAFSADVQVSVQEKAMSFLTGVIGLDVEKYAVQARVDDVTDNKLFDKVVKHTLTSEGSMVDVISLFRNNKLVWCKLYPIKGLPQFTQKPSTRSLDVAKTVLDKLQEYSSTTCLPTMRSMLNTVSDQINSTKVMGEVKQKISFGADSEDFQWSHNSNGIENSHKAVVVTLRKGNFGFFCDDWDLYTIGNTNVEVSSAQAVQVAKQSAIDKYADSANQTFPDFTILDKNAKITLTMQDRGDYTLYPLWEILLPLDKAYGAVTCIQALVWADTGEVPFVAAVGGYGVPNSQESAAVPSSTSASSESIEQNYVIVGVLVAASAIIVGYLLYKRRR